MLKNGVEMFAECAGEAQESTNTNLKEGRLFSTGEMIESDKG